ncbi:MAG: hypothetical protein AAFW84_00815 [Cyanobacteria bacterium J06635_15]
MLTIRTMNHVATSRTIPGFRACRSLTGCPSMIQDQGRRMVNYANVLTRDAQRKWRRSMWEGRR